MPGRVADRGCQQHILRRRTRRCSGVFWAFVLGVPYGLGGCSGTSTAPAAPGDVSKANQVQGSVLSDGVSSAATIRFEFDGPLPAEISADPVWDAAAAGDPADLARLAQSQGAVRLMRQVVVGGRVGGVALEALAYAPDVALVRAECCQIEARVEAAQRGPFLVRLAQVLAAPNEIREPSAPAAEACRPVLQRIQSDPRSSASERDQAAAALEQLGELAQIPD